MSPFKNSLACHVRMHVLVLQLIHVQGISAMPSADITDRAMAVDKNCGKWLRAMKAGSKGVSVYYERCVCVCLSVSV